MLRKDIESNDSRDNININPIANAALTGSAIAAAHATISHAYPVASIFYLAPLGDVGMHAWEVTTAIAGYNIYLDDLIASCVTALGITAISNDPLVDTIAKCALAGAVIGAGVYSLFGSQHKQTETEEPAPEVSEKFQPA